MTISNNTADSDSVETASSEDRSQTAPGEESQDTDWQARAETAEASLVKANGELSSANGRVNQLRQERETSNNAGFVAGIGDALKELAQAQERGDNEGLASRVETHIDTATKTAAQARLAGREQGYINTINGLIETQSLDVNATDVSTARTLFNNATTEAEMKDAVAMIKDLAHTKEISDIKTQLKERDVTVAKTREDTLKETNAKDLLPGAGNIGGGSNTDNRPNRQVIQQGIEKAGGLADLGKEWNARRGG